MSRSVIQISDGIAYDVRHPELVMVGFGALIIGIPGSAQEQPVYERVKTVSLGHVVKLLPLPTPKDDQQVG